MAVASKEHDNGVVEFQFHRPENRTKWETFQRAIYDPSTKQFLGRTPKNWGQLLLFYTIFYIVLGALFAICMQGLFATLSETEPRWKLDDSLIGVNPGLGFRPISSRTEVGSLIWYNITNQTTINRWVNLVDEFLEPYKANQTGENYVNCDFDKPPGEGQVCVTSVNDFGNCNPERKYGFSTSSPCMFLKLNRIYGWQPDFYTSPAEDMPDDLKMHINSVKTEAEKKQVWISCNGLDPVDDENLNGFNYYPRGFAGYYYPYKNVRNYLSPVIAVEVLNINPNVIVNIECRAWAGNIVYRGGSLNRAGSVTFQIQVDSEISNLTTNVQNKTSPI